MDFDFEHPASLEERWFAVFRELGEPEALLGCTYTFNAEFFSDLLAVFANAVCEGGVGEGRSFAHVPVDVVCDKTRYRGHHVGYNVSRWSNSARLFHPKLFIALFSNEVIWSDGSLNLTPAGWQSNREVAMLHRPKSKTLPRQLRELLEVLPEVTAAKRILDETSNVHADDLPGEFVTSLHGSIGSRYFDTAPKHADELHLVAPFFEQGSTNAAPLDVVWLRKLVRRYPDARFHIYLPQLETEPLRVQGSREMFVTAEHELRTPIIFHPVEKDPGPLHGKIACIVHTPKRTQRAFMLIGSPNMTHSALLAPVSSSNIEVAWFFEKRWRKVERFLSSLGTRKCSIDDIHQFVPPLIDRKSVWMPLRRATFDPLKRKLQVEWEDAADANRTVLRYAGKTLALVDKVHVQPFQLIDGIGWLETRKRGGGTRAGCCPIEIPVELLPACKNNAVERTPDEWLKMLGAISEDGVGSDNRSDLAKHENEKTFGARFEWSDRVRDLAARMRYLEGALIEKTIASVEQQWLHKLFQHIYDAHDLGATSDVKDQIWRSWVRIELWHAARRISHRVPSGQEQAIWRKRAKRLRRRLSIAKLPTEIQSQFLVTIKALGDAT